MTAKKKKSLKQSVFVISRRAFSRKSLPRSLLRQFVSVSLSLSKLYCSSEISKSVSSEDKCQRNWKHIDVSSILSVPKTVKWRHLMSGNNYKLISNKKKTPKNPPLQKKRPKNINNEKTIAFSVNWMNTTRKRQTVMKIVCFFFQCKSSDIFILFYFILCFFLRLGN